MSYRTHILILLSLFLALNASAQKPFTEGTVTYKVKLESADHKATTGTYTFIIKGEQIRKEIKLNNGFQDVLILDCVTNKVYSLQNRNGKKYAIELSMPDIIKSQQKFTGFMINNEENNKKNMAGCASFKGKIKYKDGSGDEILYTKDWQPAQTVTFERFPDAKFFPLLFSYKGENNLAMEFEADKVSPGPVENAVFRIPSDYKMISNKEYKELTR